MEDLEKLSREFTDRGKLIAAGWVGLRIAAIDPSAPQAQLDEMKMAFFAGAMHLFRSIMTILDEGEDATEADLRRMTLIDKELKAFGDEFELRHMPTKGTG